MASCLNLNLLCGTLTRLPTADGDGKLPHASKEQRPGSKVYRFK